MTQATDTAGIVSRDKALQPPLYAKRGVALQRGEGVYLWDSDGKRYLDLFSNYGVNILGHAHPAVTEAIQTQAATLLNCHQSFANDVRVDFLQQLLDIAPESLTHAFLSNSGTEAVEAALKFAWIASGRSRLVAARHGYHGRTIGALAATAEKKYRDPFAGVLAEATHVTYGDADQLHEAMGNDVAAIVLEPIQGEGGINVPPAGYLAEARQIADDAGALLIFDEIQTGFRTGAYFACQHEGVWPDLMCLSKGLANGVPVGATLMTSSIAGSLEGGVHGTTFGGNPLAAAAGLATLKTLANDDLLTKSAATGEYFLGRLQALEHPKIREVRGRGLMIGVELKGRATPVLRGLQERGVLALMAGPLTLRFLPPLLLEPEQVDVAIDALVDALAG